MKKHEPEEIDSPGDRGRLLKDVSIMKSSSRRKEKEKWL